MKKTTRAPEKAPLRVPYKRTWFEANKTVWGARVRDWLKYVKCDGVDFNPDATDAAAPPPPSSPLANVANGRDEQFLRVMLIISFQSEDPPSSNHLMAVGLAGVPRTFSRLLQLRVLRTVLVAS